MKPFKFLNNNILLMSHDGPPIHVGNWFYSVAKEDYWVTFRDGKRRKIPKYSISPRFVGPEYRDKFRPDYERLWYFKSKTNAEYLIRIWKRQDNESV